MPYAGIMCSEAPGLVIEKERLATIGASFLGIIGNTDHDYGYHLCNPPAGDYSTQGAANKPVCTCACAIDAGMDWAASRSWISWLITEIREKRITGIAEVIGSLDGKTARYWSDSTGWGQNGKPYYGGGHVTWTHVAVYRSTAKVDHRILAGWTATGYTGGDDTMPHSVGPMAVPTEPYAHTSYVIPPVNQGAAGFGPAALTIGGDFFQGRAAIRLALGDGGQHTGSPRWTIVSENLILESGKTFGMKLPTGTVIISVQRLPVTPDDLCTMAVSMSIEYGPR